jgi:membrane-associated phospholipid phosphatase
VVLYAAMWIGYLQNWAWLTAVDNWFLDGLEPLGAEYPAWVTTWDVICTVLGPTAFRIVGVIVIIRLLSRRYLRPALFLVLSVELSGLVTEVAKRLADRARPETAMVDAWGTSFPSGHALAVMAGVLAFLTLLLPIVGARWRAPLIVGGVAIVVIVGAGRVVLNVHHPSDVVAGWALGYLWYLACLQMLRPVPLTTASAGIPEAPGSGH